MTTWRVVLDISNYEEIVVEAETSEEAVDAAYEQALESFPTHDVHVIDVYLEDE